MVTFTFASALALALLFGVHLLSERSRNQLRRYAAWLSTTLRSIGDAVIATDGEGRVTFMNAVAEKLTGWTQDEARGKPLDEFSGSRTSPPGTIVENPVDRVLREGVDRGPCQPHGSHREGWNRRPIEDSAAPIREGESIHGVVLVFRDASEARERSGGFGRAKSVIARWSRQ